MKILKWISLFLIAIISIACNRNFCKDKNKQNEQVLIPPALPIFVNSIIASDTLALNTDTLLYYQRSACFGFCPTYNYIVYQSGMIKYDGIQHVDFIGTKYGLAKDIWWDEVKGQIRKSDFFNLENIYPIEKELYIPDLPNTILVIKEFGMRKAVIDNHHAPKNLKDFEFFLESHFQKIEYIKSWN